jgi:hypothetical protein
MQRKYPLAVSDGIYWIGLIECPECGALFDPIGWRGEDAEVWISSGSLGKLDTTADCEHGSSVPTRLGRFRVFARDIQLDPRMRARLAGRTARQPRRWGTRSGPPTR